MSDHLDRAAEVLWEATCPDGLRAAMRPDCWAMAQALDAAGLLVTPARDEAIRADERAKVLAGFEVERADRMVARRVPCDCPGDWQHHGRFVGDDGPETHARFDVVPSRRYVTAWQPDTRTPQQRSDDAVDELRRRLEGDA